MSMIRSHKEIGDLGENLAAQRLEQLGYRVLQRNYKNKFGEIDIIAKDGPTLCFIEVKTRESDEFGTPFEYVTPLKQKQISKMAAMYLHLNDIDDVRMRFDVVAVTLDAGPKARVELLKNAFDSM